MESVLEYSEDALMNRVLFLSHNNDIIIFVEDQNKQYIYENIFERMLGDSINVGTIFPMNGKNGVEVAYREYGKEYDGKPAFYVVDGDFDLLLEKDMIVDNNYFYLKKYNIECYYLEENAVLMFMAGKLKKTKKEIKGVICFDQWKNRTLDELFDLFLGFVISKKVFPNEKTIGIGPNYFILESGEINRIRIEEYISKLSKKIVNYDELKQKYMERFTNVLENDKTRLICGKFMLASLQKHLISCTGKGLKIDDFIYDLSIFFNIEELSYIKEGIISVLRQYSCT